MFLKQISDRGKVLLIYVWLWCDLLLMGCLQMFKRFHDHNNRQGLVMSQECTCHLLDSTWPPRSWHHLSPSNSWHATSGKQQYYCQYVTIIVPTLGVYFQINPSSVLQTLLPLLHHHTVNFKKTLEMSLRLIYTDSSIVYLFIRNHDNDDESWLLHPVHPPDCQGQVLGRLCQLFER